MVNAPGAESRTLSYDYDSIGNIKLRSDVGSYNAGAVNARPHGIDNIALAGGGTSYFRYDANGNMNYQRQFNVNNQLEPAKSRCTSYTSFNMPRKTASSTAAIMFNYGPDHERTRMTALGTTTVFVHPDNSGGLMYERDTKPDLSVEHRYFVTVGGQAIALITKNQAGASTVSYMHHDNLGSVTAMSNEGGTVTERFAYEPFGKRRYPAGGLDPAGAIKGGLTDRGYTSHQHLDSLGLIHMNGRVYDPMLGRFLSADPTVPDAGDMQSLNRYAYTRNNPLTSVDMDGYDDTGKKGIDWFGTTVGASTTATTSTTNTSTYNFVNTAIYLPGGGGLDFWNFFTAGSYGSAPAPAVPKGVKYTAAPIGNGNSSANTESVPNQLMHKCDPTIQWVQMYGQNPDKAGSNGWRSATFMTLDWVFGTGSANRHYDESSASSANMKYARRVVTGRDAFYKKTAAALAAKKPLAPLTNWKGSFGLTDLLYHAGTNPTQQFIGSYRLDIIPVAGDQIQFQIQSNSSFKSFLYGIGPEWERETFPMFGNMRQTYTWKEPVTR
ncbi:RHS repeat-associated core domain-containing protein [Massilia sp. PAMC28688]|uniref:RHS repeat domain-containing protein n=1 Tax=Massilia sp. PAMC28688 TaxID=2861283 RepID=UPI001C6392ED|nr:RHS repeat-associated core domain-containing protein [Massilia sp. PAMC28688]QYF94840.1 RHS repeat-associated core domain-containing protein [Massilia sp. PAMC28688]